MGVKSDFNIPKLELFQSFASAIENVGSLMQYTADVSERLLITHCKRAFKRTSHNSDFAEQIVRLLNRKERMHLFNLYALMRSHSMPLINSATRPEQSHVTYVDPTLAWVQEVLPDEQMRLYGPQRPVHNHFLKGILHEDSRGAFNLTVKPDSSSLTIPHLAVMYKLDAFTHYFEEYLVTSTTISRQQLSYYNALQFQT